MDNPGLTVDMSDAAPSGAEKQHAYVDVAGAISPPAQKMAPEPATAPYAGMGKEDLLRFSQTPFWSRLRLTCLVTFWLLWLALLVTVVVLTIIMPRCTAPDTKTWYEHSVVYDVYVPSFYDIDADGMGDIKGVTHKLDYIKSVEADTLTLSSIYESDEDGFTDIIDHTKVDVRLGNLDDVKELVRAAHDKGLKVLLDFIPNHTSRKHRWFLESEKTGNHTTNPYWNYYTWAPCTATSPPNNWLSVFGESAWEYIASRDECVLHTYLKDEPALNLRSASVQDELARILKYWMTETDVDGFRIRSASFLSVDADLRNDKVNSGCTNSNPYDCMYHVHTRRQAENYELVARWRRVMDDFGGDRILAVESSDATNDTAAFYGGAALVGAQLPINALLSQADGSTDADGFHKLVADWLAVTPSGATATWASASSELGRQEALPVASLHMLKLTLPGTAFAYYGEELGMRNANLTWTSVDPAGNISQAYSRDPYRTPMQWSGADNAGFTNSTNPWLPANMDGTSIQAQDGVSHSPLSVFRSVAKLRAQEGAFQYGDFNYAVTDENVLSYTREFNGQNSFLVALNLGKQDVTNDYTSDVIPAEAEVVVTTTGSVTVKVGDMASLSSLSLRAGEGVILKWEYRR